MLSPGVIEAAMIDQNLRVIELLTMYVIAAEKFRREVSVGIDPSRECVDAMIAMDDVKAKAPSIGYIWPDLTNETTRRLQ